MAEISQDITNAGLALAGWRETAAHDEAFAELVSRHSRLAFQVAYSILRNRLDAEDVVQEAFLRIYRSRASQRMDDEKAFIARVAWRLAIRRAKSARSEAAAADFSSALQTPEQSVIEVDQREFLANLIESLPDELRQPLALSTVQGLNSQQIGKVLSIPEGTVRSRLARARQVLKEKAAVLLRIRK